MDALAPLPGLDAPPRARMLPKEPNSCEYAARRCADGTRAHHSGWSNDVCLILG